MDLSPYLHDLDDRLAAAAALGDDDTRQIADRLASALEPAARLALLAALSDLASEISAMPEAPAVQLRLDGQDVLPVLATRQGEVPPPAPPAGENVADLTRITLRLPEELKLHAEDLAARAGVSLNAWLTQAVRDAVHRGSGRSGTSGMPGGGAPRPGRPQDMPSTDVGHSRGPGGRSSRVIGWVGG